MTNDRPTSGRPSLARSTGVMMAGTLLSRLTGFARTVVLAAVFGKSLMADSYNVANTLPNIVYDMILGGILSATLIPVFVQRLGVYDQGRKAGTNQGLAEAEEAENNIAAVNTLAIVVAIAGSVLLFVGAPWLAAQYITSPEPDSLAVATILLRFFAPQVLFYVMVSMSTALLQARRRFGPPMFAPVANNLVVIFMLLTLERFISHTDDVHAFVYNGPALWYLGLGTTAGVAAMALIQSWYLRRADVPIRWRWNPGAPAVRRVIALSGWTLGFVAATQVALLQITNLATSKSNGDYSAYSYSLIFFQLPYGVYAVSVMSAIQPDLAEFWHGGKRAEFGARLATGLRSIVAVMVPAGVGLSLLAGPIIQLILQRGNLHKGGAAVTGTTLAIMALALPGYSVFQQVGRAFQAMEDTRTLFFLYVVFAASNIAAAYLLYPLWGILGLAAAFSLSYTVTAMVAMVVLAKLSRADFTSGLVWYLLRVMLASAVMGAVVGGLVWLAGPALDRRLIQLAVLVAGAVAGGAVYLGAATVLGVPEPGRLVGGLTGPLMRRFTQSRD